MVVVASPVRVEIQDDLTDAWVVEFAAAGFAALEAYLAKHNRFHYWLAEREAAAA